MTRTDPYTPASSTYECTSCPFRETSEQSLLQCPECGDPVRNIAVPRE